MTITRRWWWAGGAAAVGIAAWIAVSRTRATAVDTATVTAGPLSVTVDEAGTTRARRHADVNAPVAGRWAPREIRAGDRVRAGDVLGYLYPAPLDATSREQALARVGAAEAALREAEARVVAATGALDEATRTLARLKRVAEAGGVSDQELERAKLAVTARQSDLDGARQRTSAARYDVTSARAAVAPFTGGREALSIGAPVGGLVLRVIEEHERVVGPGTPLAEVGDQSDLEAVIPLLTSDASRVRDGAPVAMTFDEHGDTLHGRVSRVEPSAFTKISALGVEEQRVNVIATAPGTGVHVGDQFRVHARVTVWESARVIRIPASALVRDGERWFTFVVSGGRAVRRPVTIGERGGELVEVRGGLVEGDRVVVYPGDRVTDGLRVAPRR